MMLGFLLARAGVEVQVLEKHADFLRDFRGDTLHSSTLELMYELGLLDELLQRPHQEARQFTAQFGDQEFVVGDFSHLPTHCRFIALMPQWDFLNFLAEQAQRYPTFHLRMQTEATQLIVEGSQVVGARGKASEGPLEIRADLVVAADGRHSTLRRCADLPVVNLGAPMDVLWMRISRRPTDQSFPVARFDRGRIVVLFNRDDYWQFAYVIRKGGNEEIRSRGLEALRADVAGIVPWLSDRVGELKSWDDIKLLTVTVDRLTQWHRPGLLCIGDAAHAMSPIGGVGINLAIQDAVAAANILARPLAEGRPTQADLARVQRRRLLPTRLTQSLQLYLQNRLISRVLAGRELTSPPWPLRLLLRVPFLRRLPARFVGVGFRPEHIQTPDVLSSSGKTSA